MLRRSVNPAPLVVVCALPGVFLVATSFSLSADRLSFVVAQDAVCWVAVGILMRRLLVISPRPPAAVVIAGALSKWQSSGFASSKGLRNW